ncbi:unnamed protein product [Meganyctiphanes norvegica]|uniref:Uncharacterized protein n=1 Tax=Meganyctiphanes norvegica TaxID=48144 RepID=A0AAV2RA04_MEGNR
MPRPEKTLCQLGKTVTVVAPDRTELDKEITPILAELMTLGPGNDQHPAVSHLYNWLVNSQCTGEEFTYVIGELVFEVSMIMQLHFLEYLFDEKYCTFLCKISAEALAMKCHVLEGPWEQATWALVVLIYFKHDTYGYEFSVASNCLCAWIVNVIGNADICPNPYLRYELMIMLTRTFNIDGCERRYAIESVLSACSSLNLEYLSVDVLKYHRSHAIDSVLSTFPTSNNDYQSANLLEFQNIKLFDISIIFKILSKDGCLLEFDKKLAEQLLELKSSRCSAIIYDIGYCFAVNPSRFTEPRALYGLIALLKTLDGSLHQIYKEILKENYKIFSILMDLQSCCEFLYALISYFKASCQTIMLSDLVRSCISYILEIVIRINEDDDEFNNIMITNIIEKLAQLLRDLPNISKALLTSPSSGRIKSFVTNTNLYIENFQAL